MSGTNVSFPVSQLSTGEFDLSFLNLEMLRGQTITIAGRSFATTTDVAAALSWVEER
jgi:hypothetical protein